MTTGERIKQRRLELGMTQTELAEKTGYSDKSSIAVIESGKNNLRQSKIQAFADALDCDPLWLIGLDAPEEQESNTDIYNNIIKLCESNGINVRRLETDLNFSNGSIGKLKRGGGLSAKRAQAIADYFGVSAEYVLTGKVPDDEPDYYLNADARAAAEFLHHNPKYKVLFDAARNVSEKDIDFVKQMIDRVTGNE